MQSEPTMRMSRFFLSIFAVFALTRTGVAQPAGEEWVEQCRRAARPDRTHATHCEVREIRIPARGTLRVDGAENGAVIVRSHEGSDVIVQARVQASGRTGSSARRLAERVRVETDGTIRAAGPRTAVRGQGWAVSYEILVPARTDLEVRTRNGPIAVSRVSGDIRLHAVNGAIAMAALSGRVRARAETGAVSVALAGRAWSGEGLDVRTVSGPVTLRIPRGYAARLESGTPQGPIRTLGVLRAARHDRRGHAIPGGRIASDLNGGGPTIRAVTASGPVNIEEF
jgi:hypothetical protein